MQSYDSTNNPVLVTKLRRVVSPADSIIYRKTKFALQIYNRNATKRSEDELFCRMDTFLGQ